MIKAIGVLFAGLMLVGCATTKPEMPGNKYTEAAKDYMYINHCNSQGWMPPDIAAAGSIGLKAIVNSYTFNADKLNKEIDWVNVNYDKPTLSDCRSLSMKIQEYNQRNVAQNQIDRNNQRDTQDIINNTRIKNTFCNRIGTQTTCSTY